MRIYVMIAMAVLVASLTGGSVGASEPMVVSCKSPFGEGATPETIAAQFGAGNVETIPGELDEREDRGPDMTVLFGDYRKTGTGRPEYGEVTITWPIGPSSSGYQPGNPKIVAVEPTQGYTPMPLEKQAFAWQTLRGLTIGLTIEEVEALNGGPFELSAGSNSSATVVAWNGGKLEPADGPCVTEIHFLFNNSPPRGPIVTGYECPFCGMHHSDDPAVRNAKGFLSEFRIIYPPAP